MTREAVNELKKYTLGKKNTEKVEISILNLNRIIKALEQEPRWIPVSERLPEPDVEVLVTDDAGGLATISTDSIYESEATGEKEWYTSQRVTAWMPLPKPYREVEE